MSFPIRVCSVVCLFVLVGLVSGCGEAQSGSSRINRQEEGFVEVGYVGDKPVYLIFGERPSDSYQSTHSMGVAGKLSGRSTLHVDPPGINITLQTDKMIVMHVTPDTNYQILPEADYDGDAVAKLASRIMREYETATAEDLDKLAAEVGPLVK